MRNWTKILATLVAVLALGLVSSVGYNIVRKNNPMPGQQIQLQQQGVPKGQSIEYTGQSATPPSTSKNPSGFNPKGISMMGGHRDNLGIGANGTPTNKFQPQTQLLMDRSKAVMIKTQLQTIPEVTQANVIVGGSNVVVGYKAKEGTDINKVNGLVAQKVKQMEPLARKIAISQNDSVIAKINRLSEDIYSNRKAEDVLTDISNLAASIGIVK